MIGYQLDKSILEQNFGRGKIETHQVWFAEDCHTNSVDLRGLSSRCTNTKTASAESVRETIRVQNRPRAILSPTEVKEIFRYKQNHESASSTTKMITSPVLAKIYGVGAKTIRDIWNGRTWSGETSTMGQTSIEKPGRYHKHHETRRGKKAKPVQTQRENTISTASSQDEECPGAEGSELRNQWQTNTHMQEQSSFLPSIPDIHQSYIAEQFVEDLYWEQGNAVSMPEPVVPVDFIDPFHDDWQFWQDHPHVQDQEKP